MEVGSRDEFDEKYEKEAEELFAEAEYYKNSLDLFENDAKTLMKDVEDLSKAEEAIGKSMNLFFSGLSLDITMMVAATAKHAIPNI